MSPEGLSIRLRQRVPWEAAELGLSLVRENFGAVMRPWLFLSTLWACLCGILVWFGFPNLALLIFWWFQPLIERVIIHVLSRRAFGPAPTFWQTLRAWPSSLRHGWFGAIGLWRFVPHRAFYVPVYQLEGLSGKAAEQRRSVLSHDGDRAIGWGIMFAHIEGFCFFALVIAGLIFSPLGESLAETMEESFALTGSAEFPDWFLSYWYVCYAITVIFLRPGYVAGSFTLYLNRRMQLEGWDLELAFRRLASRLGRASAVVLLTFACLFQPPNVEAAPPTPPVAETTPSAPVPPRAHSAQEAVQEVMKTEEFEDHKTVKSWGFDSKDNKDSTSFSLPGIELILKAVAYLMFAVALFFVIRLLVSWIKDFRGLGPRGSPSPAASPTVLKGVVAPRTEEVFGNVPELAWKLWQAGERRRALGLLYRGTLHELTLVHHLELTGSLTEGECVRAVRRKAPGQTADYFARAASCWQGMAYAHREPEDHHVQSLCEEWSRHFARNPETRP